MSRVQLCACVLLVCAILSLGLSVGALAAPDPGGVTTGSAQDVIGATPGSPTASTRPAT